MFIQWYVHIMLQWRNKQIWGSELTRCLRRWGRVTCQEGQRTNILFTFWSWEAYFTYFNAWLAVPRDNGDGWKGLSSFQCKCQWFPGVHKKVVLMPTNIANFMSILCYYVTFNLENIIKIILFHLTVFSALHTTPLWIGINCEIEKT